MKVLRSTFWVALFFTVVWLALLLPRHPSPMAALLFGDHLKPAILVVAGDSGCSRSGDEVLWRCAAPGVVEDAVESLDGAAATLRWTSPDGVYAQPGSRLPILATRWLPLPLGPVAVAPEVGEPRAWGWRELQPALRLPKLGLLVMATSVLLTALSRVLRARGADQMELDVHRSSPGCAALLLGIGIPLFGFRAEAAVGWACGLVVVALLAQLRRLAVVDRRAGTLTRGWQLFLWRRLGVPSPLGELTAVAVARKAQLVDVSLARDSGGEQVLSGVPRAEGERQAGELARFLSLPVSGAVRSRGGAGGEGAQPGSEVSRARPRQLGADSGATAVATARAEAELRSPAPVVTTRPGSAESAEPRPVLALAGCLLLLALGGGVVGLLSAGGLRGLAMGALAPGIDSSPFAGPLQGAAVSLLGDGEGSHEELAALVAYAIRREPESDRWQRAITAACRAAGRRELLEVDPSQALAALEELLAEGSAAGSHDR